MSVLETDRLILRRLTPDDAEFMLELLTDPSWIEFIGDRGVRTVDDARDYILKGAVDMYARLGFGLFLVESKDGALPLGICGLVKRDFLEDVDIGFAFLPRYWGNGYAYEAAAATMRYATEVLKLERIVAITMSHNHSSARLLEKLGLRFERMVTYPGETEEVRLFAKG